MLSGVKIRVGILFGGMSAESGISARSAANVLAAIDRDRFDPVPIGIGEDGRWRLTGDSASFDEDRGTVAVFPGCDAPFRAFPADCGSGQAVDLALDVVFPVLHGPFGEDGTVQGLLRLAGIPFVGSGVLASAVGMDKIAMKMFFRDAGIPAGGFLGFRSRAAVPPFAEIEAALGNPVFVKPANMGSSIGIGRAHDAAGFAVAVDEAFRHDSGIIVEECVRGREIECAVLGNADTIASVPGEIIPRDGFYSYDAKYVDGNGAEFEVPARLDPGVSERVRSLSIEAFRLLGCAGLARVDFFVRGGEVLVNEINTIPGFTDISMYPRLWEASGIGRAELVTRLIALAMPPADRRVPMPPACSP